MQLIQATAPAHWVRANWQDPLPTRDLVVLCEENTFPSLPPHAVAIVLDSVRYPKGFLQGLPNKVVTLDAPAEGCSFMWTPVKRDLFHPKPWSERAGVICPVRLKNYPMRQKHVDALKKMGVKIIERDDAKRSYQDYVADLCSARAVVNFCADRKTGKPQMKGRVFETLTAGAVLLEECNANTGGMLPLGSFFDWHDLDELRACFDGVVGAELGKNVSSYGQTIMKRFSAEKFWGVVETIAHRK